MTLSPRAIIAGYFVFQLSAFCHSILEEESSTFFELHIFFKLLLSQYSVVVSIRGIEAGFNNTCLLTEEMAAK